MDEMLRLVSMYANRTHLSDDELGLYRTLVNYLELQYRLLLLTLEEQAKKEGFTDEQLRGYTSPSA